jgi:hypothetical protein
MKNLSTQVKMEKVCPVNFASNLSTWVMNGEKLPGSHTQNLSTWMMNGENLSCEPHAKPLYLGDVWKRLVL